MPFWDKPVKDADEADEHWFLRFIAAHVEHAGDDLNTILDNQEKNMAALDGLTAAVADLGTAVSDMQARLAADDAAEADATAALSAQVTDLQGQVAALTANQVDQVALDALTASIAAIAATVAAIAAPPPPPAA